MIRRKIAPIIGKILFVVLAGKAESAAFFKLLVVLIDNAEADVEAVEADVEVEVEVELEKETGG